MIELGVETRSPFTITAAIVARLAALDVAMRGRDVAEAVVRALAKGSSIIAVALSRAPLHVHYASDVAGIKLHFKPDELRAAFCHALRERSEK